ncbi:hypothetical protein A4U49_03595 [Acidithiobacillus ferrivorans]|nr:hypothetical protein A4U49_03595 [Acidithiobacillus ferrivorans]
MWLLVLYQVACISRDLKIPMTGWVAASTSGIVTRKEHWNGHNMAMLKVQSMIPALLELSLIWESA